MFNHITGEKLREFRLQSGLSIATAADAVSVTPAFISIGWKTASGGIRLPEDTFPCNVVRQDPF